MRLQKSPRGCLITYKAIAATLITPAVVEVGMSRVGEHEPTPAISRPFTEEDRDVTVRGTPSDTVTFSRGWGDSGYRVETVEHDCPACSFDRMIRKHSVTPVDRDHVAYFCLNPNCRHYVSDVLSYACKGSYPHRDAAEPVVTE